LKHCNKRFLLCRHTTKVEEWPISNFRDPPIPQIKSAFYDVA